MLCLHLSYIAALIFKQILWQIVAVAARSKEKADEFAKKFSIANAYGTYEELAKDANVGKPIEHSLTYTHTHCTHTHTYIHIHTYTLTRAHTHTSTHTQRHWYKQTVNNMIWESVSLYSFSTSSVSSLRTWKLATWQLKYAFLSFYYKAASGMFISILKSILFVRY